VLEKTRSIKKEELDELKKDYGPKRKRESNEADNFDEEEEGSSEDDQERDYSDNEEEEL